MHPKIGVTLDVSDPGAPGHHNQSATTRANTATEPGSPISPQQAATAQYIAAMSGEMAGLATGAGLRLVAHLLAMAQAEAEHAADRAG